MSSSQTSLLPKKTLCVITGASRGIGKEIAVRLASNLAPNSRFLLLARNEKDLAEVADKITKNSSIYADYFPCDLSKLSEKIGDFEKKVASILKEDDKFDQAMIIHNAGTVGDVSRKATDLKDGKEIHDYLEINLVSFILLNNAFLRVVSHAIKQKVVINITSLLAIKSMPGFGLYAMGKAAREAFMRSLAAEDPELRVINYSPGPVKTDMTMEIKDSVWDAGTKTWFEDAFKTGTILTVDQTVTKFLHLLDTNRMENGAHIDYYDDEDVVERPK